MIARWLIELTRPVLTPLAFSTVMRVVDKVLGIVLFALGGAYVASIAGGDPILSPWAVVAALVALSLLKGGARYLEQFSGHHVAFRALEILRTYTFGRLWPQAPALAAKSGDLMARATKDVDRVEVFFAHTLAPIVAAIVVPTATLVTVGAWAGWDYAVAMIPGVLIAVLVVPLLGARSSLRASATSLEARGDVTHHVTDSIQGVREVVGYGHEARRAAQLKDADAEATRASLIPARWVGLRRGIALACQAGTLLAVVAVGMAGQAGPGELVALGAVLGASFRVFDSVRGVEDAVASVDSSLAAARRLHEVATAPPAVTDGLRAEWTGATKAPEVRWENVSFTYPQGGRPALADVSLTARAGEWTSIVGASGSGKTTLVRMLARFWDPQHGRITIGCTDIREVTLELLYATVAFVEQRPHLFAGTVASNLKLARPDATDAHMTEALETAGLPLAELRNGLNTPTGERGGQVSGGQAQRIALARALLRGSPVIVLDEFSASLDHAREREIRGRLRGLEGVTIIEITHNVDMARKADATAVMDSGKYHGPMSVEEHAPLGMPADGTG